ncbi:MAG: M4 family metallopeptidase [Saprospiraceae bacterium]|nr:M4 family metallopeptidase [Saprospiraceae bacterium]
MKINFLLFTLLLAMFNVNVIAQSGSSSSLPSPLKEIKPAVPLAESNLIVNYQFNPIKLVRTQQFNTTFLIKQVDDNNLPTYIAMDFPLQDGDINLSNSIVLREINSVVNFNKIDDELVLKSTTTDELGLRHQRFGQVWKNIPVYGAEILLHDNGAKYYLLNGNYYPSPNIEDVVPTVSAQQSITTVKNSLIQSGEYKGVSEKSSIFLGGQQSEKAALVIYHKDNDLQQAVLAWEVSIFPNIFHQYKYFVDAKTGEIIHFFKNGCSLHAHSSNTMSTDCEHRLMPSTYNETPLDGPATANATDLLGQSRSINTYKVGSLYYLLDASRPMFNAAQSTLPNDPKGVILTLDAFNTYPENSDFQYDHITSSNNAWNNPTAISAHYNGGLAYLYYKNTFNRNSINGTGGNIISLINISDENGQSMGNAFWNGAAMFYGNGDASFFPLAKALDVAGHEMSHGVVQSTANLEYQGESGAMNEAYADIFGSMIDRNDWKIGEDVVKTSVFPSGALRDLSNPHNGGTSLNDNGWQPNHVNEKYTGSQDNGGVHINSGIINFAYYKLATATTKEKSEQIFYKALSSYLTMSSKFVDCRNAAIQAATDLYGANSTEVNAVTNAFAQVGIGAGTGGGNNGQNYQHDLPVNPGQDYIIYTGSNGTGIYLANTNGSNPQLISSTQVMSKPSVTDAGNEIVFIDQSGQMRYIFIDWSTGDVTEDVISTDLWRNAVFSKDGYRIAAVSSDFNKKIYVYDFNLTEWKSFDLYNPTYTEGIQTGDVQYADALEFDYSGQNVMYDAFNIIDGVFNDIEYWDVGFVNVSTGNSWANGSVNKLFSALDEGESIGNPSFSKNSPYIVSFDYINGDQNALLGVNIENGNVGSIYTNNQLSYANYSKLDNKIIFNASSTQGNAVVGVMNLATDKINSSGSASVLINNAKWGIWFTNGSRALGISTVQSNVDWKIKAFPNPTPDMIQITLSLTSSQPLVTTIYNEMGQEVMQKTIQANAGANDFMIDVSSLHTGNYFAKIKGDVDWGVIKFVKQ